MASHSDSNKDSLKESVLMNLRSVTQSRKGGVPLSSLDRDYKDLLGHSIPFKDLNYSSLESFLKAIPDVIKLRFKDGHLVAEGVADSSTAHIVSLVNRQKTTKVAMKPSRRPHSVHRKSGMASRYSSYNSRSSKSNSFQNNYSVHVNQANKHSKFTQNAPKESIEIKSKVYNSHSPERPKIQPIAPRKYETAPRFLKLQQKKREVVEVQRNESPTFGERNESPTFGERNESPKITVPSSRQIDEQQELFTNNFISEPVSNDCFIKSPRPLLSTREIVKNDRLKELESADTSKKYIEIYAALNKLRYNYSTKPVGQKSKKFISNLILDGKKYQSYPELSFTKEGAEEIAAANAVKAIKDSQEHLASCHETTIRNAEDVAILINRIEEIVYEKPSGMFENGIVSEYENKFGETLPENWLQLLQQSSIVEIEELDHLPNVRVPEGVNHIVRRARQSSGSTTPSSVSDLERADFVHENSNLSKNIVRKDHLPEIPALQEPIGNEWSVFIVDVSKTIAARLVDYDAEYLEMMTEMKIFYSSEYLPAVEISESLLYAAYDASSDLFHRVLVQKIKENDRVECYNVDEGTFVEVSKSDLQELQSNFWMLPYQAIHMTLDGLEDLYNPEDLKCLLKTTLIALIKRCGTTMPNYFPEDPAIDKKIYSVVLFDTNKYEDEDVNMNEIIKEKILEKLAPKLPKPGISESGYYLSHIENTGELFLRKLPLDSWLEVDLEKLSPEFEEASSKNVTIPFGKIFVAKYEDGIWYRAILLQDSPSKDPEKVKVFFIDYGNFSTVPTADICELEPFSEFLTYLEPQAIKCELFNALPSPDCNWAPDAVTKLTNLVNNEELIIRVISEGDDITLPKVNLYKRIDQNGDSIIISINDSIANMPELFKTSTYNENSSPKSSSLKLNLNKESPAIPKATILSNYVSRNSTAERVPIMPPSPANDLKWALTPDIKSPDALEDHNLSPLKLPDIPDEGQFDVFVTMAASPHNFYVQPYRTVREMNELMEQMNQFYACEDNLIEMHKSLLKENGFYAVKHKDGNWYRAQLQTVIDADPSMLVVIYVDYGDIITVNLFQVQSLYSQFRHLPCQGIKASLAGVRPVEKDWKTMQCVEFQNMVKENKFVSIIKRKNIKEIRSRPFLELELILIDVSNDDIDVYIHELLINKGIALPL